MCPGCSALLLAANHSPVHLHQIQLLHLQQAQHSTAQHDGKDVRAGEHPAQACKSAVPHIRKRAVESRAAVRHVTLRLERDRLTAASTDAGVGRALKMLGTYFVSSCRGAPPLAAHCAWKSPRMPVGAGRQAHSQPAQQSVGVQGGKGRGSQLQSISQRRLFVVHTAHLHWGRRCRPYQSWCSPLWRLF